jgi:hypothetical protein
VLPVMFRIVDSPPLRLFGGKYQCDELNEMNIRKSPFIGSLIFAYLTIVEIVT